MKRADAAPSGACAPRGAVRLYASTVYVCPQSGTADWTAVSGGGGGGSLSDGDKGDITVSGSGATWTIDNNVVSNAKLATVATATFKGRTTAGTGNVEDLTATQATALLNAVVGDSGSGGTKGLVPAPASGDATKCLSGAGTWVPCNNSGLLVPRTITQTGHGLGSAGTYWAVYKDTSNNWQWADNSDTDKAATGVVYVVDANTLYEFITPGVYTMASHGFSTTAVSVLGDTVAR